MKEEVSKNVFFAYHREIEYMAALAGIMADNLDGQLAREIFGESFIAKMKSHHRELLEILNSLFLGGMEMLEFFMYYPKADFKLEEYREYIEKMTTEDFLYQFFGYRATREEIQQALQDDIVLAQLMDDRKCQITSFVNLKRMIQKRSEFLDLYFSAVEEVKTPELEDYLNKHEKIITQRELEIKQYLKENTPMEVVTLLMNKGCVKVRDYKQYTFIPVCMLPRNAVMYYEDSTFVLYSRKRIISRQQALNTLKVLADDTRIRIIDLLSESVEANGKKIAAWSGLAPSTISHHMEQLIECGIVKEEKNGNTKVYSINQTAGENLLKELEGIILKNTDHKF